MGHSSCGHEFPSRFVLLRLRLLCQRSRDLPGGSGPPGSRPHADLGPGASAPASVPVQAPTPAPIPVSTDTFITSPFVGTFYRSSSPETPAFVEAGSTVKRGQPLCIVEAMKLFNELEAEFPCVIEAVLLENAQPVEYGAKLFRVRKL